MIKLCQYCQYSSTKCFLVLERKWAFGSVLIDLKTTFNITSSNLTHICCTGIPGSQRSVCCALRPIIFELQDHFQTSTKVKRYTKYAYCPQASNFGPSCSIGKSFSFFYNGSSSFSHISVMVSSNFWCKVFISEVTYVKSWQICHVNQRPP